MKARNRFLVTTLIALVILLGLSIYDVTRMLAGLELYHAFELAFWLRAWMPFFFDHLSEAVAAAAIITFSLALSEFDLGSRDRLLPAIRPVLYIILGIGLINGLWFGVLGPRVELQLDRIAYRSQVASDAIMLADEREQAGDLAGAASMLRLYTSLVDANDDLLRRIENLSVQAAEAERERLRLSAERGISPGRLPRAFGVTNETIPELLQAARQALADDQFYTAHYYANLAVSASERAGRRREDALELRAQALNAIEDGISRRDEDQERSRYREKLEAYQLMQRGEDDPLALIRAFYRFQDLRRRLPDDPDVERYLGMTREALQDVAFMVDDAREVQRIDGRPDVVFVNRRDAGSVEIVYARRVVQAPRGDFFYGVEILRIPTTAAATDGLVHLQVPYARRIDNRLALRSIEEFGADEDLEQFIIEPRYLAGGSTDVAGAAFADALIPLVHPVDQILLASGGADALATFSLPELLSAPEALEAVGHTTAPARSELVGRIIRIVGFFVLAFLAIGLAWEHRSRYVGRPPVVILLLVPLLPLALTWLVAVVRSTVDALILVLVGSSAANTAVLIASGVMVLALIVAVASLARQTVST